MDVSIWKETLLVAMTNLWGKMAGFVPNLLAAVVVLVLGYIAAKFVSVVISKLLAKLGVDKLSEKVGVTKVLKRAGIKITVSAILGAIAFWLIMLTFLVSAVETLGLERVSATIDDFVLYLPNVFAAVFVLLVGLFIAHFVRDVVRSGAAGIGVDYSRALGSVAYSVLAVVSITLAVSQLDIDTDLVSDLISIVMLAVGVAVALALGLGTRDMAGQIVAGIYARELFEPGKRLRLGDVEGTVKEVGTVKTLVELDSGEITSVSNRELITQSVTVSD